jgi:5-methylcytosine-specific restriction protein A
MWTAPIFGLKKEERMEITEEMTREAYAYSKKVYQENIERNDALDHLENNFGMNRNSAADYLYNFQCMMTGKKYSRTNNAYATDYFLKNILADYGSGKLKSALLAVEKHLVYYENKRNTTLYGIRRVYDRYRAILNDNA